MRESLAAFTALLLGLCLPAPVPSVASLGLLLAALTVVPVLKGGQVPCEFLGLPGDWTPMTGGGAP